MNDIKLIRYDDFNIEMIALYNETVINEQEAINLIHSGDAEWDDRIIILTKSNFLAVFQHHANSEVINI